MTSNLSISLADIVATLIALSSILLLLLMFEWFQRRYNWNRRNVRKIIHIIVGILVCIAATILESNIPILVIALLFLFIDWWAIKTRHFVSIHPDDHSLGTVFYPISIFVLALLFWYTDKWIFITASLLMIIPDALAGLIGLRFANSFFTLLNEKKSLTGTITMFISSFLLIIIAAGFRDDLFPLDALKLAFIIAVIATASELLSIRGSDNLSVPLISGMFIYAFLSYGDPGFHNQLLLAAILAILVSVISYYLHFLTVSGAVGTFILSTIIFGFGGLAYTVPILTFFITSSLLSRAGKRYKKKFESSFEKTGVRDFFQVWANGGIPAVILIIAFFTRNNTLFWPYLAAVAAANADTWATELGIFSKKNPRLVTNMQSVPRGTSGAISLSGSFASFVGSLVIVISAYIYLTDPELNISLIYLISAITISGMMGSFIDSLIGATIQAQYRCNKCAKITEKNIHCDIAAHQIRGSKYMNNDLVNFLSLLFAALICYTCINIFY